MIRRRITCLFAALLLTLAMVLSACQSSPEAPGESVRVTDCVSDDVSQNPGSGSIAADSFTDTSGDTDSVAPPEGGIIPPDVEGTVSTPLMWHVTAPQGGELYLLGSIHVGLKDTCLFTDAVYNAFDACDALAVECDVLELEGDMSASVNALRQMVYKDGSSISAHIDGETYEAARAILTEAGYYSRFMDYYYPIVWQEMIDDIFSERTEYKTELGVDRYFLSEAKRLGKEVLEVEDYMETYAALAGLSYKTQAFLLNESIAEETVTMYNEGLSQLYGVWKAGVLSDVEEYLADDTTGYTPEELECVAEYDQALMTDRNVLMVAKADEYLRDGRRVFYVVGLAHMIGEDGLVQSLTAKGYDVQQVH